MASGLILFTYIGAHLTNHALGLISLDTAEAAMQIAVYVWSSLLGTVLLYGAFAAHFAMALWAVYERRTFRLPPLELLRIVLGFTMPILLIGHAASTRLAYELFGLPSDYSRIISNLWATGSQGWQLALMAPGWLHGCLGLYFAFGRRAWCRRFRLPLFSAALLLPVLSALGFIAMGRELAVSPAAAAAALQFLSPKNAAQRLAIAQWRDNLLDMYFTIIAAVFIAREIRNLLERRGRGLVSVSFPGRVVQVPRGWSVLEASRSFHLPHAAMCGGRARCSTCRVQVIAGRQFCPAPAQDEQTTLDHIGAMPNVRLACQLRPQGDISVVPMVRTARPIYRVGAPQLNREHEIAVLYCDLRNRQDLAVGHLPQDLLYVWTLYAQGVSGAVQSVGGTMSTVEADSICALFGVVGGGNAAQNALRAAGAIEAVVADLNSRLGNRDQTKVKIGVSIHVGRAAVGEIGYAASPMLLAVGEAMDGVDELRKIGVERDAAFAISGRVYAAAGLAPMFHDTATLTLSDAEARDTVYLSNAAPIPSPTWTMHGAIGRRAMLRRLWAG